MSTRHSQSRIRWLPVVIIVALAILAIILLWSVDAPHRQSRVLHTVLVLMLSFLLMLLWLLFFSRLRWKVRLLAFGAVVLIILLSTMLFRVKGFSGDLVPLLEWRWGEKAAESLMGNAPTTLGGASKDYPQFLGPHRNGTVQGIKLARDWSERPPQLLWRQPIGAGWSAFAVAGNSAITQEQRGEYEMVVCYDLHSGREQWSHSDRDRYEATPAGVGPRATPTIVADRVYTLGATGLLNCLDLATGERIWSEDILYDNDAELASWGMSGSPLVLEDLVVVSAGGGTGKSLVAYHKDTGERVWRDGSDPAGYSSPLITTLAGVPQILIFNYGSVTAHDPSDGQVLWQQPWPNTTECIAQPVPLPEDHLFVSSGYGIGCKLFQILRHEDNQLKATLVWETPRLKAKFTNVVYRDGYIYGLDDGVLVCLDLADGQRKWKRGRYGHGQVILVDGPDEIKDQNRLLLVSAESGDVLLVEVNPNESRELSRFPALASKTWNNPALAGQYLLVRNDREAACYELPLD
ncbi:PQQ-like beta-propeller repeat protein [Candidatus Poribacteria bacterium]|nr:PQQ-like beta-propeller repeat protein [Candidatus Poribacteria bacterium]